MNLKYIRYVSIIQLIIASLICIYFSSIEYIELPKVDFEFMDKILHLSAFFIYGLSLQVALIFNLEFLQKKLKYKLSAKKIFSIIFIFGAIFAASDEIHQYYVPGRSSDILDWVADILGIGISLSFYKLLNQYSKKIYDRYKK